jgi:hypothetical protein
MGAGLLRFCPISAGHSVALHDQLTGVLASLLAKRAPGYTSLGFPEPPQTLLPPSADVATTT